MPRPALGLYQVDAAEQQRKLLLAENHLRFFARGCWPPEPSLLQTLVTPSEMQLMRPQRRVLCE